MTGLVVTTSVKGVGERAQAMALAAELGCTFVPRLGRSLEAVAREAGDDIDSVMVVDSSGLSLQRVYEPDAVPFFFHPGMALNRIKRIDGGSDDYMVEAMGLSRGMSVLDCTLGLASDAIVSSYVVGDDGRVVGLEASQPVAAIVRHGLSSYRDVDESVKPSMLRIEVHNCDYASYLAGAEPGSYDVVYFDPMFARPVRSSPGIAGLRHWACDECLPMDALRLAQRAAKARVVVKDRRGGGTLARLGISNLVGGRGSNVEYGIVEGVGLV